MTAGEECVDRSVCLPASGSCHATNAQPGQTFCHHCVDDTDCANPAAPNELWACRDVGQGQMACIYQDLKPCTTDADCPTSPGQAAPPAAGAAHGECLDEDDSSGVGPGSSVYRTCWFPYSATATRFGCFPAKLK